MSPEKEFDARVIGFKRGMIRELLNQCTEPQKSLFDKMYGSIDEINVSDMRNAYGQCARTLEKNDE